MSINFTRYCESAATLKNSSRDLDRFTHSLHVYVCMYSCMDVLPADSWTLRQILFIHCRSIFGLYEHSSCKNGALSHGPKGTKWHLSAKFQQLWISWNCGYRRPEQNCIVDIFKKNAGTSLWAQTRNFCLLRSRRNGWTYFVLVP
jgi:hypothetical protein